MTHAPLSSGDTDLNRAFRIGRIARGYSEVTTVTATLILTGGWPKVRS